MKGKGKEAHQTKVALQPNAWEWHSPVRANIVMNYRFTRIVNSKSEF